MDEINQTQTFNPQRPSACFSLVSPSTGRAVRLKHRNHCVCSLSVQSSFAEFIVHNNLIWYWCSSSVHPQSDRSSFSCVETSHLGFILKYFVFRRRRRCLVHTFLYTNCMLQLCLNSIYNDASVGECRYFSKEPVVPPLGGVTAIQRAVHTCWQSSCWYLRPAMVLCQIFL